MVGYNKIHINKIIDQKILKLLPRQAQIREARKKLGIKIIPCGLIEIVNMNKIIIKGIYFFWKKIIKNKI